MIDRVRSPWIRRPLVVLVCVLIIPLAAVWTLILDALSRIDDDYGDAIRHAWRGPA
jgi:hypothetical protein